jgi:hypothetical protein
LKCVVESSKDDDAPGFLAKSFEKLQLPPPAFTTEKFVQAAGVIHE